MTESTVLEGAARRDIMAMAGLFVKGFCREVERRDRRDRQIDGARQHNPRREPPRRHRWSFSFFRIWNLNRCRLGTGKLYFLAIPLRNNRIFRRPLARFQGQKGLLFGTNCHPPAPNQLLLDRLALLGRRQTQNCCRIFRHVHAEGVHGHRPQAGPIDRPTVEQSNLGAHGSG